jgi:excisionase family DNA binding protein
MSRPGWHQQPGRPFLLAEEVASLLGCSLRTVHELTRTRAIPHRRPPGTRRLLFVQEELQAWMDGAPLETKELPRKGRVVRPARG